MELQIPDFSNIVPGMIVRRSDHCIREMCLKGRKKNQLGVIVDFEFYADARGLPVAWPVVHWEGSVVGSTTHPINVAPYRKTKLPMTTMIED